MPLALLAIVDVFIGRAFVLSPVLGAAMGYLAGGLTGAASGFLIPVGPLLLGWLLEAPRE